VVVPSPPFFGKGWPNHELGLVTREVAGNRQLILPVWDKVTKVGVISCDVGGDGVDRCPRSGAIGATIDACALDRDPDISGIRALNSCRARHRLPGLSVRMGSRSVTG
jgi:hypothetical protein